MPYVGLYGFDTGFRVVRQARSLSRKYAVVANIEGN